MSRFLQKLFPFALLILVGLVILIPLFHSGFIRTDDGSWMVIRLSAFYQSFREGQFPVRFLGRLNNGYGYPVANFLYPGFLYIGSIIHILGFSFVETIKIILGASVVLSGIWVYVWLRKFFTTKASLVGAITFLGAPYFLYDVYTRGSVGEVFALSVAAFGFYALESAYPWLFAITVSVLILAHNTLALLFVAVFVVYIIVRKSVSKFFWWFVLGVSMSGFFWIPALYEQKYVVFSSTIISNPAAYFIQLKNFWLIGVSGFLGLIIVLVSRKKKEMVGFFTVLFLVSLFLSTPLSSLFWKNRLMDSLFQFPFRFLSATMFASAWLIAASIEAFRKYWTGFVVALIACTIFSLRILFSSISYEYQPESFYTTNQGTTTVQNEYMPRWVSMIPAQQASSRFEIYKGAATVAVHTMTTQYYDLTVHADDTSILQINTMYYPGWGVTVDDQLVPIDYKHDTGTIRIPIPMGDHHVIASFRETISRFVADIFSFSAIIVFIIFTSVHSITVKKKSILRKHS